MSPLASYLPHHPSNLPEVGLPQIAAAALIFGMIMAALPKALRPVGIVGMLAVAAYIYTTQGVQS